MEPNKILSASILDLIFDDRNKEYGAYDLRATYPSRIKKSMIITGSLAVLVFGGAVLGNSFKSTGTIVKITPGVFIDELPPEEIIEPEIPEQKPVEEQIQTEQYTTNIVMQEEVDEPPPTTADLDESRIDVVSQDGLVDPGLVETTVMDGDRNIIEPQKPAENTIYEVVQVPARYDGNWERFLTNNLRAEIPIDNGAPTGSYKVIIQFVVDKDGSVSDIKPLTSHGYGMEEEAVRVLKKAKGWKAGINAGFEVKSYHRQPITFVVQAGE